MVDILVPMQVPSRCFLAEALEWIAHYKYPIIEDYDEHNDDCRFSDEYIYDFYPHYYSHLSYEDLEAVGLPQNPENYDTHHSDPTALQRILSLDLDKEDRKRIEIELKESIEYHKELVTWQEIYDDFVEIYKSKLYIELREGRLKSFGHLRPQDDADNEVKQKFDAEEEITFQPIPKEKWRLKKIDWDRCALEFEQLEYCLIHIETEDLLKLFPSPQTTLATDVTVLGTQYILNDTNKRKLATNRRKGRPESIDWTAVHVEIATWFKNDELPDKQEAFILEMQAWCLKTFKHKPARSTLLDKISPYYKVKKSENNQN